MKLDRIVLLLASSLFGCAHMGASKMPVSKSEAGCEISYSKTPFIIYCDDIKYDFSVPIKEIVEDYGAPSQVNTKREHHTDRNKTESYHFFSEQYAGEPCPHTVSLGVPNGQVEFGFDAKCDVWYGRMLGR